MKELYIIRHCQATGQEPAAPLTELGQQQAQRLVTQLSNVPLDRIVFQSVSASDAYHRSFSTAIRFTRTYG